MADPTKQVFRIVIAGSQEAIFKELTATDRPLGAIFNSHMHTTGLRPVEIHQVQSPQSRIFKSHRHFQRMLIINLFLRIVTLGEPDAFSIDDIYCGDDFHYMFIKLLKILSPTCADFSGWNCTP